MLHHRFCCGAAICLLAACLARGADNDLTSAEKASGWRLLFDGKTTRGWHTFHRDSFPERGWKVEDGWLHCLGQGGGDIVSDGQYKDFELKWEWKLEAGGNSGLKYFVLDSRKSPLGHEYQLLDDDRNEDARLAQGKRVTAAFYDVLKPQIKTPTRPIGEVNQSKVIVHRGHVEHWLNGVKVLEYDCDSARLREAVAKSKFKNTAAFGSCQKGYILLQDHGSNVWFRDLKLRILGDG